MTVASPLERVKGDDEQEDTTPLSQFIYQTVFGDQSHGERAMINPRAIMRMRVERNETA